MSLERARHLLLHDQLDEAHALLVELARGEGATARRARIEAGRLAVRQGEVARALDWFREGWGAAPTGEADDETARLEAARYLGELLERTGEHVQAEAVLRRAVDEAGQGTEGAALSVSLAAVLLALDKRGEAKLLADVAARALWEAGDERAVEGLLVRAMAIKATQGRHYDALEPVYALPPETQDLLLREAIVGQRHRARFLLPVLLELDHWHKAQRGGISHPQVLALLAELGQQLGRTRERIAALESLALYFLGAGEAELHTHAMVALARAHAEAKRPEKGVALLVEAAANKPAHASALLREAGSLAGDPALLAQSIEAAGADEAEAARSHAALGVLRMHRGEPGARESLEQGARLPAVDPDAQLARLHLVALDEGATCGCGEAAGAMSRALQHALVAEGPADLVHVAGVIGTADGLELRLELTREPSPEERAFVDGTVARVRARFERGG